MVRAADSELWLVFEASGELGNGITASISDEMDFYDNMGNYSVNEIDLGIEYSALSFLNIGFIWDQEFDKSEDASRETGDADDWVCTHYTFVDLTWYMEPEGWYLEDRTRFVYAMPDEGNDYFRFRNRIKVKGPWKITKLALRPWTAWEFYWDDKENLSGADRLDRQPFLEMPPLIMSDLLSIFPVWPLPGKTFRMSSGL